MSNSFFMPFRQLILIIMFITISICCLFLPVFYGKEFNKNLENGYFKLVMENMYGLHQAIHLLIHILGKEVLLQQGHRLTIRG